MLLVACRTRIKLLMVAIYKTNNIFKPSKYLTARNKNTQKGKFAVVSST